MITRLLIFGLAAVASSARAETPEVAAAARTFAAPPAILRIVTIGETNTWTELLHKTGKGEFTKPVGDEDPRGTFSLADIRPNVGRETGTPHKADYLNLWGMVDPDNKFHPAFVTLVSEDWQAFKPAHSSKPDAL